MARGNTREMVHPRMDTPRTSGSDDAHFFSQDWHILGDRGTLVSLIAQACHIPRAVVTKRDSLAKEYLEDLYLSGRYEADVPYDYNTLRTLRARVTQFFDSFSVAQRMSWAARRIVTRIEDEAYCLLGLFDVNMPVLYGEGPRAFLRLQQEIMGTRIDHTIFAWGRFEKDNFSVSMDGALLAKSVDRFQNQGAQCKHNLIHEVSTKPTTLASVCRCPVDSFTGKQAPSRVQQYKPY